jgi:hypothetical protein
LATWSDSLTVAFDALNSRDTKLVVASSFLDRWLRELQRRNPMIRKVGSSYRLYSRKADPKTGRRRNLGTFKTRAAAEKHERAVQFFKHHG